MNPEINIVSQAFQTVLVCWKTFLGCIGALYVLDTLNVFYDLDNSVTVAKGFAEAAIIFYICLSLLGLDPNSTDHNKKFTGFAIRYLFLLYAPVFLVAMLMVFLALSAPQGNDVDRNFFLGLTFLSGTATYFVTMFMFGTAFPSHLLGIRPEIGAAIGRAFRQAGYLVPRLLLGVGFFTLLPLGVLLFSENLGIGSDPITATGVPNPLGALALAIAKLMSGFSLAVFAVVVSRAYLKDLGERGELTVTEVEVFT